jgi:ribosomal protein L28
MRFRVIATLAVLIAAVGVLVGGVSNAAATTSPLSSSVDPQLTNIPYLAWAGSTVKVSRCIGIGVPEISIGALTTDAKNGGFDINKVLQAEYDEDIWTGDADQKPFFTGSAAGVGDETSRTVDASYDVPGGGICWSTYITSDKAGMVNLKFSISADLDSLLRGLNLGPQLAVEDDVLVIWMLDSAPTLTESDNVGDYLVGDPGGNGSFSPIADANGVKHLYPGLIEATVTGTFPIGTELVTDYSGTLLDNGTITLPNDWVWLANHFAEDASLSGSAFSGAAATDWDIHDDDTNAEGHVPTSGCIDMPSSTESVDNCVGSAPDPDLGPFSSIFGLVGTGNDAWGPFDPIRGWETLLSDGNLNADDAPMPALEVDVALTNAGAPGSVGTLSKADKSAIFNRNTPTYGGSTANIGNPHMLYAPFYKSLIPAALPFLGLNGTSGTAGTLNVDFRNYLTLALPPGVTTSDTLDVGQYDYWDTFNLATEGGTNQCNDVLGNPISTPTGNDYVAVYTDEHGQAYLQFNPANSDGEGIVLTPGSNGRCDVYTGSLTGTATIQAVTVYPGQPPADPSNFGPKLSNILTKTVNFTPLKTLNCIPKGENEAYCVETVTDFEGNPVKAEVEFTAQGPSGTLVFADSDPWGGYDPSGQESAGATDPQHQVVDLWTSPTTGEAAVAIESSDPTACIDVAAENVGTENGGPGIFRFFDFNPATGVACGTNTGTGPTTGGTTPPTTGGTTSSGSSPQSSSAPVVLANVTAPAPTVQAPAASTPKTKKVVKVTLVSAHVVSSKAGRYLTVRVNSSAKTATLRITLINKKGAKHIVLRKVATNHVVRVGNLKLAANVVSVKVALA